MGRKEWRPKEQDFDGFNLKLKVAVSRPRPLAH